MVMQKMSLQEHLQAAHTVPPETRRRVKGSWCSRRIVAAPCSAARTQRETLWQLLPHGLRGWKPAAMGTKGHAARLRRKIGVYVRLPTGILGVHTTRKSAPGQVESTVTSTETCASGLCLRQMLLPKILHDTVCLTLAAISLFKSCSLARCLSSLARALVVLLSAGTGHMR